jgi:membrane protein implicated in regulation of membrane protease activity
MKSFSCERCGTSLRFNAARASNFGLVAGAIVLLPLMGLLPMPFRVVRGVWLVVAVIALLLIYPIVAKVDRV